RGAAERARGADSAGKGGADGRRLPLAGLRVADFFWLIAGPATSRVLADLGAEVIKIESSGVRIDNIRTGGVFPTEPGSPDQNGVFNDCNTNKRSLTLNLNHPRGIEIAKEIVRRSDIVTNNFTGDRMDRWGMGYEELRKVRPDLIMLTMPVMGTTGPYKKYGAYGNGVIGYGGLRTNMGFPGRAPVGIAPLYSDFSTPYVGVSALMSALVHRERTGEGQFIDLSQLEATVGLLGAAPLDYQVNGRAHEPAGNRAPDYAPHGAYPCYGEDRWIAIAVREDADWRALSEAMGDPALAGDARFATLEARKRHEDALDARLAAWTREHDAWQLMHLLQARGVMAGVVEDLEDMVVRDPHLSTLHFERVVPEGESFAFTTHRQPARFDGVSPPLRAAPGLGADNQYVLRELLGLSDEALARLVVDHVME
ncbi:MAG: CoA transferase, partial [Chloroflexi bacterium]|nr:CoA transferase [Chloroflexota bacterium]